LVENSWEKNYNYFIDLFVQIKELYENMTITDVLMLNEVPYPIFNDIILKQINHNKLERKRISELNNKTRR
jgi:hypothetical protein